MTEWVYREVRKHYGRRQILAGVDFGLRAGQCVLLRGENGAGKSTLLRILAGMERPDHARVTIDGVSRRWRRYRRQLLDDCIYLHQTPYLFEGSVRYNLNYPLRGPRDLRAQSIREALGWSGLNELADSPVHQLSGGERQRLALARAWLRRPKVMLLDEPTTNMDQGCRRRTVQLLQALKREGVALLVTSHEPAHFAAVADGMFELAAGRLDRVSLAYADLPDTVTPIDRRVRATA